MRRRREFAKVRETGEDRAEGVLSETPELQSAPRRTMWPAEPQTPQSSKRRTGR